MTEQTPRAKINKLVEEAYSKINEAEKIAEETDTEFSFDLAYGMGGTYVPRSRYEDSWESSIDDDDVGWVSSSAQC